jgi:hypothetical protein
MQLRNARLCLDCEEIHDAAHCPACASESFAFITRWVPIPSGETGRDTTAPAEHPAPRPRPAVVDPAARETVDTYRQLLDPNAAPPSWRMVKRGAVGLAIFGLAGWMWKHQSRRRDDTNLPPDQR